MHPYLAVPATTALVWRAYSRNSLTPAGIVLATLTAIVHAIHPWSVFFALLVVFFLAGTAVTKVHLVVVFSPRVKHDVKARLTLASSGSSGGESQRTHIQVLANSAVASALILLHYRQLLARAKSGDASQACWRYGEDLLPASNYAAVAADTFSSELGILSRSHPRLLTSWDFRRVPPGTNGGITLWGTLAGFLGASTIALTSVLLLPFCSVGLASRNGKLFGDNQHGFAGGSGWGLQEKAAWVLAVTVWGGIGSLLDSALGGWFQASVIDARTGKVVEGTGGKKVPLTGSHIKQDGNGSRRVESGISLLDNNGVNLLMALTMSVGASADISNAIDQVTADGSKIPGCVFCVVNKHGKVLFEHASGRQGAGTQARMTLESIFWIASCTKMICGIAAMQLCEQGKISLDDADKIEELCPELKEIRILKSVNEQGKPELIDKKTRITLRMFYSFFNENLRQWGQPFGCDEFSGLQKDVLDSPLLFEPGTKWEYGVGIDWAGTVIERISGMSLDDYLQKNIFQPLGIKNISFFPSDEMKNNLAHMHQRDTNGNLRARNHLLRRPLVVTGDEVKRTYNSAGAGCFAQPAEYCQILATLLNDGVSPTNSTRILSQASITEMFTNQIPQFPNFGRQDIPAAKPDLTNPIPDMYPQPPEQPQGWGLTFMLTLHPGPTGRGANTAWWAGLANLYWWCDREKGVAGMCASQILPFAGTWSRFLSPISWGGSHFGRYAYFCVVDPNVLGLWAQVESMVYANLEEDNDGKAEGRSGTQDRPIR
ncbi:MAG: hypothetical protein L6R40_004213 [Gallowayella cf. fulva]|nr:MAG: hypothetical protein L6R40_004213 [Xanthomendoza cf. fulva]